MIPFPFLPQEVNTKNNAKTKVNIETFSPLVTFVIVYSGSATSFPKYHMFPSQITKFGTSCKRPHLETDREHFYSRKFEILFL